MKHKTILVTGVNGFVGQHVARTLHENDHTVIGTGLQDNPDALLTGIVADYYGCDLTDPAHVGRLPLTKVDAIINLAGLAKVGESRGKGDLYNRINVGVHTTLYDACIIQNALPRIIAISSGSVYDPRQPPPIDEDSALVTQDTTNEYTWSKVLAEQAIATYRGKGLDCITVRPFNHTGPGQLPGFLIPDLGEQIVEAKDAQAPLKVGNLETKRDYTDVRDVAHAYMLLATAPAKDLHHSIYNVCSGRSVAGTEILRELCTAFGAPELETEQDPDRMRKNDIMDIYGSRDRLTADTGWSPQTSVQQMMADYANWKNSL